MIGGDEESRPADGQGRLVFHYNRERRLQRAPEPVRRAWAEGYTPNRGFIRGLTANAGLKSILVSILLLVMAIYFVSFFGEKENSSSLDGIEYTLRAFLHGETVYVTVTCTSEEPDSSLIPVSAAFTALDASGETVSSSSASDVFAGAETRIRTTFQDYEIARIRTVLAIGSDEQKKQLTLSVSVDRN